VPKSAKRAAVLRVAPGIAWGVTIAGAFTGFDDDPHTFSAIDERVWLISLAVSLMFTMGALLDHTAARNGKVYAAAMRAGISRPYDGRPSRATTGPLAQLVALPDRRHERHATPRR
jgi:hypothetical protein